MVHGLLYQPTRGSKVAEKKNRVGAVCLGVVLYHFTLGSTVIKKGGDLVGAVWLGVVVYHLTLGSKVIKKERNLVGAVSLGEVVFGAAVRAPHRILQPRPTSGL